MPIDAHFQARGIHLSFIVSPLSITLARAANGVKPLYIPSGMQVAGPICINIRNVQLEGN